LGILNVGDTFTNISNKCLMLVYKPCNILFETSELRQTTAVYQIYKNIVLEEIYVRMKILAA